MSGRTRAPLDGSDQGGEGFNGGPGNCPAEPASRDGTTPTASRFNGGPGNCPAELSNQVLEAINVLLLQWRAGQLSGRTPHRHDESPPQRLASMEGRAIVRPNPNWLWSHRGSCGCFNGGPGNCPAEHRRRDGRSPTSRWLQWRAGQLSGRTRAQHVHAPWFRGASMEGRAIVRPNRRLTQRSKTQPTCFNGGPGNCPAEPPDDHHPHHNHHSFNGGPGNCPAEPACADHVRQLIEALQWRAGQLSGRTLPVGGADTQILALQWRAGQLSGRTRSSPASGAATNCFNGGPGNCPAEPRHVHRRVQRRPASMEGRAIVRPNIEIGGKVHGAYVASMEGRAIVRPNPERSVDRPHRDAASMEGRAIVRPNRSLDLGLLTCPFAGTCERSRKLGLRRCPNSVVKVRFALWHKASSGPRDSCAHHSARIR